MADCFVNLLLDNNALVVQLALESLQVLSATNNFEWVINKIMSVSPAVKKIVCNFAQKTAVVSQFDLTYIELIGQCNFVHRCLVWNDEAELPQAKKIKTDENDLDTFIDELKSSTSRLVNARRRSQLSSRQIADVKRVINNLEMLLI